MFVYYVTLFVFIVCFCLFWCPVWVWGRVDYALLGWVWVLLVLLDALFMLWLLASLVWCLLWVLFGCSCMAWYVLIWWFIGVRRVLVV